MKVTAYYLDKAPVEIDGHVDRLVIHYEGTEYRIAPLVGGGLAVRLDLPLSAAFLVRPNSSRGLDLFPVIDLDHALLRRAVRPRQTGKPDPRGSKPDRRQGKRRLDDKTKARLRK